jgi:aerobic carbon-monoxide dehydrogenase medium subunit
MKPPRFRYFEASSVEEALGLLAEQGPEARVLAGGQSLIQLMNFRVAEPTALVDINGIESLAYVRPENGTLSIGAMTRLSALERDETILSQIPLIAEATGWVAYPAIRNRATLGGVLAYGDSLAELPAVMVALDAEIDVASQSGNRSIPSNEFFIDSYQTVLEPGEVITGVRIPSLPARTGASFMEFAARERDYGAAGVAVAVSLAEDGTIASARIGLCCVTPTPVRASAAEDLLRGKQPDREAWKAAATSVRDGLSNVLNDVHGSADYRRHLAGVLIERALATAASRAEGDS